MFGSWAAELADQWDDESMLGQVKDAVGMVLERTGEFVVNEDIEVQERVSVVSYPQFLKFALIVGVPHEIGC